VNEILVHTGQHFDHNMSQVFFDEMEIPAPHYNLEISGLNHGAMTGRMLERIEEVLLKEKPDYLLVYGDTNSTLAGALAAVKLHIPVAHVEAGLRSFEMRMPEEVNRILTDRISHWLFCPTQTAVNNLKKEGFDNFKCNVALTGDVMYDAVLYYRSKIADRSSLMQKLGLAKNNFVLATLHRAENTNDVNRLKQICEAFNEISKQTEIVLPLHPRTRAFLQKENIKLNALVIEPVGYFDMLALLENCRLVMTDSGGLQKEAYFFGKFCLTLRDQTEWVELLEAGVNALVGADKEMILAKYLIHADRKVDTTANLYGDGKAAAKVVSALITPH
jgi:UDP-GlcNAc3NAcA epimerase